MIPQIVIVSRNEDGEIDSLKRAESLHIQPSHVLVIRPEKDELTVDQVHALQKDIQVSFSHLFLVIIYGLDLSSSEVQNSLLKSLEEEAERIQFIIYVSNLERIIPTILSRCTVTKLPNIPELIDQSSPHTHILDYFSYANNSETTKEQSVERIDRALSLFPIQNVQTLRTILGVRKLILDNNMNSSLALDSILIFLTKQSTMKVTHEK